MFELLLVEDNEINRDLFCLERTAARTIRQSRRFANGTSDSATGETTTPVARPKLKSFIERYF